MAIPWLIGAAVVGAVTYLASSDDDDDSSSRSYRSDNRAEKEREENKRELTSYIDKQLNILEEKQSIKDLTTLKNTYGFTSSSSLNSQVSAFNKPDDSEFNEAIAGLWDENPIEIKIKKKMDLNQNKLEQLKAALYLIESV